LPPGSVEHVKNCNKLKTADMTGTVWLVATC